MIQNLIDTRMKEISDYNELLFNNFFSPIGLNKPIEYYSKKWKNLQSRLTEMSVNKRDVEINKRQIEQLFDEYKKEMDTIFEKPSREVHIVENPELKSRSDIVYISTAPLKYGTEVERRLAIQKMKDLKSIRLTVKNYTDEKNILDLKYSEILNTISIQEFIENYAGEINMQKNARFVDFYNNLINIIDVELKKIGKERNDRKIKIEELKNIGIDKALEDNDVKFKQESDKFDSLDSPTSIEFFNIIESINKCHIDLYDIFDRIDKLYAARTIPAPVTGGILQNPRRRLGGDNFDEIADQFDKKSRLHIMELKHSFNKKKEIYLYRSKIRKNLNMATDYIAEIDLCRVIFNNIIIILRSNISYDDTYKYYADIISNISSSLPKEYMGKFTNKIERKSIIETSDLRTAANRMLDKLNTKLDYEVQKVEAEKFYNDVLREKNAVQNSVARLYDEHIFNMLNRSAENINFDDDLVIFIKIIQTVIFTNSISVKIFTDGFKSVIEKLEQGYAYNSRLSQPMYFLTISMFMKFRDSYNTGDFIYPESYFILLSHLNLLKIYPNIFLTPASNICYENIYYPCFRYSYINSIITGIYVKIHDDVFSGIEILKISDIIKIIRMDKYFLTEKSNQKCKKLYIERNNVGSYAVKYTAEYFIIKCIDAIALFIGGLDRQSGILLKDEIKQCLISMNFQKDGKYLIEYCKLSEMSKKNILKVANIKFIDNMIIFS